MWWRAISMKRARVAASGQLGAILFKSTLPIRQAARLRARTGDTAKPAHLAALTDGEDFELLFTVAPGDAVRLRDGWKEQFPDVRLSCIGKVTSTPGVRLRDEHGERVLSSGGFDHFAQRPGAAVNAN